MNTKTTKQKVMAFITAGAIALNVSSMPVLLSKPFKLQPKTTFTRIKNNNKKLVLKRK